MGRDIDNPQRDLPTAAQAVWFRTRNSLYTVDVSRRQIRRIVGINQPTPRQGHDWRTYVALVSWPPQIGRPVLVVYGTDGSKLEGTLTSVVTDAAWN